MIKACDLVLHIGNDSILRNINLDMSGNGIIAILGGNGAGKTQLLRCLSGVIQPTTGYVQHHHVTSVRTLGYVAQSPSLLSRSVKANLRFVLRVGGFSVHKRPQRIDRLLAMGQLEKQADQMAWCLSLGQQRRLAVLMALACYPPVLMCDELTAHLDMDNTKRVEQLCQGHNRLVIWVTHDMAQVRRLAQRVIFLHNGAVLCDQSTDDFFAQPSQPEVGDYLRLYKV